MRKFALNSTVPTLVALLTCLLGLVHTSHAATILMDFQATIESVDDEESSEAQVGDVILGTIEFDTNTSESAMFPNNYPGAIIGFDIGIIPMQGPNAGAYIPQLSDTMADIFVGTNSFELDYFVDIFTGNFQLVLTEGPTFKNSLMTAGIALVAATQNSPNNNALDSFTDPSSNCYFGLQTDYTFGNTNSVFDYIEFTLLDEECVTCSGDVNGDGFLTGLDVQAFVAELIDAGGNPCADTDESGDVTVGDLPTFVSAILTGGSC